MSSLTSTLGPSDTLSSPSRCATGDTPTIDGACAVPVVNLAASTSDTIADARTCCGDATINIINNGCVLYCRQSVGMSDCFKEKKVDFACSNSSELTSTQSTAGGPTSASATGAVQSTGAASYHKMDVASNGGYFVVGLLAISFLSGATLL